MYRPSQFREERPEVLHTAIREIGLATLVTLNQGELLATHLPLILKTDGQEVRLEGHLARNNPKWRNPQCTVDALAVFLGPHTYVSPSWYESKREHQKVVPTWNYVAVQASGPLSVIEDRDWLRRHLADLTDAHESGRPEPWKVADAPPEFLEQLYAGVVGLSLEVRRLEGAWKMIQHRPPGDRTGTIEGLRASGSSGAEAVASLMNRLEEERRS